MSEGMRPEQAPPGRNPYSHPFMFCSGFECSYPTIAGKNGQRERVDELAKTGHYDHWKEDLHLVKDLGLKYLRYGPPYYRTNPAPDRYDWEFVDETFGELRRLGITPIADLCHFGLPDWLESFQNPDFPKEFAKYAAAFAKRYPWVRLYTPVNEILVACKFSAQEGWWNERQKSDRAFVQAVVNCARATLAGEEAILEQTPRALFMQSEASTYTHALDPKVQDKADFENQRRFIALDLIYGRDTSALLLGYMLDNGFKREEYSYFIEHGRRVRPYCILGNDYYALNEHILSAEGESADADTRVFGYYVITRQYYDRYRMPIMHTETNQRPDSPEHAPRWLHEQWLNLMRLKHEGVPIIGFTWFSVLDQVDWDTSLRENNGRVNPLGLYDLSRQLRPVGKAYKALMKHWRDVPMDQSRGISDAEVQPDVGPKPDFHRAVELPHQEEPSGQSDDSRRPAGTA